MRTQFFSVFALTLGCLSQVQAEPAVQPDFQQDQFTGRWYSIALASNSLWFKNKKQVMKMCTTVAVTTEDGNLDITSTYPKLDQCETRKSLFVRTEQPGRFQYTSPRSGNHFDVRVVETNYNEYALLYSISKERSPRNWAMVTLYGRSKELSPELQEKFTQLALAEGLGNEDILFLPSTDLCMTDDA
ncbi:lipocalin [Zootoca vivipara]|uniref:lipocalin n=1 Tax=Zootoca vivipara TaxID=8524 RepID=UPI00158FF788|nr:lipocalin [Zootoca vivipara]